MTMRTEPKEPGTLSGQGHLGTPLWSRGSGGTEEHLI